MDTLQSQVESLQSEAETLQDQAERRAARDALAAAKLHEERDRLQEECGQLREAGRRFEERARFLQLEMEMGEQQKDELVKGMEREHQAERRRLQLEVARLRSELAAACAESAVVEPASSEEALRERVSELEREGESLRLLLEQDKSERELSARLRQRHVEYEEELRGSREARQQLQGARARILELEQQNATLDAALKARDAALQEADEAAQSAHLVRRDLAAFATVAGVIISEAKAAGREASPLEERVGGDSTESLAGGAGITPLDLTLAWAHFQGEVCELRRQEGELRKAAERATERERQQQVELGRLGAALAAASAKGKEQELETKRLQAECDVLAARAAVLREAISKGAAEGADTLAKVAAGCVEETLREQLQAATARTKSLEDAGMEKDIALAKAMEAATLGDQERRRLADAEARSAQLERVNAELWRSNRSLEQQHKDFAMKLERLGGSTAELAPEPAEEPLAEGDLERVQLQLEHHRKATRRFVQEFREGVFHIIGWKITMHQEGKGLLFGLTPTGEGSRELKFAFSPAGTGCPAKFDLLDTPWAQELQDDRRAMAFLEVYHSIPGFLAHLTKEIVSKQNAQG